MQELALYKELSDLKGLYEAYGHIGEFYELSDRQKLNLALKAYEDQADMAKKMIDSFLEAKSAEKILSVRMKMGLIEEQKILEKPAGTTIIKSDISTTELKGNPFGNAIRSMLRTPDECREAFRVLLHLVRFIIVCNLNAFRISYSFWQFQMEKSLQRISLGQTNAMYTSEQSIRNKVGPEVSGWPDLLCAVGFRKDSPASPCPSVAEVAVYFPSSDPNGSLTKGSRVLQVLLCK